MQLLDLESQTGDDGSERYRGQSLDVGGRSVFGGQVVAQALVAASRSVESERAAHSLHAYFLLPGDLRRPIDFLVERLRDGRSFAARRVQALQDGRAILSMIASFQRPEEGYQHSETMPIVPPPEVLPTMAEARERWIAETGELPAPLLRVLRQDFGVEMRPVQAWNPLQPTREPARMAVWLRLLGSLPDDPVLHRCLLAYISDMYLLSCTVRPHDQAWYSPNLMAASLDHALWLHQDARLDDWLLYDVDSPQAGGARGLARGCFWDRRGQRVASVCQEGLIRRIEGPRGWQRSALAG
jgi:acyl-CoA thioesterase-2